MGSISKEFIEPFVEGTTDTFATMCEVEAVRDESKEVTFVSGKVPVGPILSIIGCSGDQVRGALILTMEATDAQTLVSKLLYEEVDLDSPELLDGFGEMINIIAGAGAAKLPYSMKLSLPTVLRGKNQVMATSSHAPWAIVPMKFANGNQFNINVSMETV